MRLAAVSFLAYACLIGISIIAILLYNPSSGSLSFVAKITVTFGGLLAWAASSAHALSAGKGLTRSFLFVSLLTVIVIVGWARHGQLRPDGEIFSVLNLLRNACGISIVWLWIVLVRALYLGRRTDQSSGVNGT